MSYLIDTVSGDVIAQIGDKLKSGVTVDAAYSICTESKDYNLVNPFKCKVSNTKKYNSHVCYSAIKINESEYYIPCNKQ